jgi:hypothetical protein
VKKYMQNQTVAEWVYTALIAALGFAGQNTQQ